jgi:molecular chaperone HtpG
LYSDHEIFLRELVSNAVDATTKLRTLAAKGEAVGELGELTIEVEADKEAKTLTIRDRGIGMSEEEVEKYLNQVAFSSAQEFLEKYQDEANIIGNFGLGFYSAFMVANKVEVHTKSYREDAPAVTWTCEGDPSYTLQELDKSERGTEVVLHINEGDEEFLEDNRIEALLNKYCKFLPVPVQFGTRTETETVGEGEDAETKEIEVPNIINDKEPIWKKSPSELSDEDYRDFYQALYPFSTPPMFWIHLNIDYPFNLTGILYFPKVSNAFEVQKNKIQLYSNQVYVTDEVKEIVPEFLTLLHGVIDSPDIPLNVSRSYLQADQNVKKINGYITKKVADKLQ